MAQASKFQGKDMLTFIWIHREYGQGVMVVGNEVMVCEVGRGVWSSHTDTSVKGRSTVLLGSGVY